MLVFLSSNVGTSSRHSTTCECINVVRPLDEIHVLFDEKWQISPIDFTVVPFIMGIKVTFLVICWMTYMTHTSNIGSKYFLEFKENMLTLLISYCVGVSQSLAMDVQ